MDEFLTRVVVVVVPTIQAVGLVIVVWGLVDGLAGMALRGRRLFNNVRPAPSLLDIRLAIGEKMVLGLEFFIASDIIQTVVVPTWESLGILAGIVAIRTVIVYFLDREIRNGLELRDGMNRGSGADRSP